MALKKSGVVLVAENYQQHIAQMRQLQKVYKDTFSAANFKEYNTASKQVVQDSKKQADALKKSEQEAKKLQAALETLGKSGKYNIKEIDAETRKLNEALKQVKKSGQFNIDVKAPEVSGWQKLTGGITGVIGKLGLLAAAIKLVMSIVNFGKAAVEVAARNETLAVSLNVMGREYGYSQKQVDFATESLKKQGITTSAARQSLIRMARANIEWSEASKLAQIAQGAAVVSGMDSSAAFERLVLGIQKMEPELLDELGITLKRTDAYEKFANTLGVSAKSLTDQQKQQAILNEIYRQSESVIGVYDAAMETAGKQQGSLVRHIEETQNSLGQLLLPFKTIWVEWQTIFWKDMREMLKGFETFVPIIKDTLTVLQMMSKVNGMPAEVRQSYNEMTETLRDLGMSGQQAKQTSQELVDEIAKGKKGSDLLETLAEGFMATGDSADVAKTKAIQALNAMNEEIAKVSENAKSMDTESFGERLGRGAQTWGRMFVESAAIIAAAMTAAKATVKHNAEEISKLLEGMAHSFELLKSGDFQAAADAFKSSMDGLKESASGVGDDFQKAFQQTLPQALDVVKEKFPGLYADWDELGVVAETSLDRQQDAIDDTIASMEDMESQLGQLEAKYDALKQVEDIQKNFNKQMEKLEEDHQQALADEAENYQKSIINENKKFQKDLANAEKKKNDELQKARLTYERNRDKVLADARREEQQQQKQHYRDLENERRRFELEQLQATRRFKVQDRRLRAEGDILALMDLREDFKLQQQEASENFELGQQESQTSFEDERKQRQDDVQARLDELKTEWSDRKNEINTAYQDELARLHEAHNEQLVAIEESHQERMEQLSEQYEERKQMIQEQRDEQLEALGESMQEEGKVTKEGMEEIAAIIAELFGDEGAGDALIKGWTDRSKSEIANLVDQAKKDIEELKAVMEGGTPTSTPTTTNQQNIQTAPGMPNIPMRQGGVGVVTGPATFSVEPGQREAFMFNPLPAQSSTMDVNMSGGFNITGGENAGKAAVEEALSTMTEEFRLAVTKFAKRKGGN